MTDRGQKLPNQLGVVRTGALPLLANEAGGWTRAERVVCQQSRIAQHRGSAERSPGGACLPRVILAPSVGTEIFLHASAGWQRKGQRDFGRVSWQRRGSEVRTSPQKPTERLIS